jgi:hypothetical protein
MNAENDFAWPFVTLKHRIIEFTKVGFYGVPKVFIEFSGFSLFKTSLKKFRLSLFFGCPGNSKSVRMGFRHLEISFNRLHQSGFLRRPGVRL